MRKVWPGDVMDLQSYERAREAYRSRIIALKETRRLPVGAKVTLVFENRETVLYQIQEMIRAERIVDPAKVAEEVATYNALLPGRGEVSATLFIEITEELRIREELGRLVGIEDCVTLRIGPDHVVKGIAEAGRSRADLTSSVHYLKFPIGPAARAAGEAGEGPIEVHIEHPHYRARAEVGEALRRDLLADLQEE